MKRSPPATPSALSRRTFLQHSAVAAGTLAFPTIIPSSARAAAGTVPPSERTTIGLIGKGVMANGHLKFLAHRDDVELVAVCQCSGNRRGLFEPPVPGLQWGHGAMGNARWRGVRLADVLARAGLRSGAVEIAFDAADAAPLEGTPDYIKSLLEERRYCERWGQDERVKDINAELRNAGVMRGKVPA